MPGALLRGRHNCRIPQLDNSATINPRELLGGGATRDAATAKGFSPSVVSRTRKHRA